MNSKFANIIADIHLRYMANWIQGHDLGNEFKAIVSHDGVATTYADWYLTQGQKPPFMSETFANRSPFCFQVYR